MKSYTNSRDNIRLTSVGVNSNTMDLETCWSISGLLGLLEEGNWKIERTVELKNPITIIYRYRDTLFVKHGDDVIDVAVDLVCEVYEKKIIKETGINPSLFYSIHLELLDIH